MSHEFRVIQDGMVVASGMGPDQQRVQAEAAHYAAVYTQDGPVRVETRSGRQRWKPVAKAALA